jgi:transposase
VKAGFAAGIIPGVERQPLKKLPADANQLLKLFERWRTYDPAHVKLQHKC